MKMMYEKPQLMDAGLAESVYTASGSSTACDCFTYDSLKERSAPGFYSGMFNIVPVDGRSHMETGYWDNSMKIEVVFNQVIPANLTLITTDAQISGNKVIIPVKNVVPAYDGDYSMYLVRFDGDGAENLKILSIRATHI
jgi:hypothetical protein